MNIKLHTICFIIFLSALCVPLYSQEEQDQSQPTEQSQPQEYFPLSLKGYLKQLNTFIPVSQYSLTGEKKYLNASLTRFRLTPEFMTQSGNVIIHADCDNELIFGNYLDTGEFSRIWESRTYNDLYPSSHTAYSSTDFFDQLKLQRAYIKMSAGDFIFTAGRQQIRFGSGKLWNPLDALNPVSPSAFEGADEQKGTDAIRLEYYPEQTTEIAVIINPKRKDDTLSRKNCMDAGNALLRAKTTFFNIEAAVIAGRIAQRYTGGADISFIVFDGMLRGSTLYSRPKKEKYFIQANCGYEYTFTVGSGLTVIAEYFYNSASINTRKEILNAYVMDSMSGTNQKTYETLSNRALTYNRHYAGLALSYAPGPLLQTNVLIIADTQGRAVSASPSITYNLEQELDLFIGAISAYQKKNAEKTSDFTEYNRKAAVYAGMQWWL